MALSFGCDCLPFELQATPTSEDDVCQLDYTSSDWLTRNTLVITLTDLSLQAGFAGERLKESNNFVERLTYHDTPGIAPNREAVHVEAACAVVAKK